MKQKKVILRAPLLTQSGYGTHARQVAKWLFDLADSRTDLEVFCEPLNWGITPWMLHPALCDGLVGRILQRSTASEDYDVSIQLQLPNEWNPFLADYNIGLTAGVETDRCNPEWEKSLNHMDKVIVPSEFAKRGLTFHGGVTTEIEVVPEAYTPECALGSLPEEYVKPLTERLDALPTKFNFLVFGQFTGNDVDSDRKNLAYTLKWATEQFAREEDVGIILKTNFGRNTTYDHAVCSNILAKMMFELRPECSSPRVYLLHGNLTEFEVATLYRHPSIKALVTATKGEGFGLPILEAAASGLPVIATNWSAHTEFLSLGKFVKLDYRVRKIPPTRVDNKIFTPEMSWAYVTEDDFKLKLRNFHRSCATPVKWAKELAPRIQESYSIEAIKAHYDRVIGPHL